MCGRWKKLAPHPWMMWPVLLRVRTVLTGMGLLLSPLYLLPLNAMNFETLQGSAKEWFLGCVIPVS